MSFSYSNHVPYIFVSSSVINKFAKISLHNFSHAINSTEWDKNDKNKIPYLDGPQYVGTCS